MHTTHQPKKHAFTRHDKLFFCQTKTFLVVFLGRTFLKYSAIWKFGGKFAAGGKFETVTMLGCPRKLVKG